MGVRKRTIPERRLRNQRLSIGASDIIELVQAFGAMQAQDYAAAKWALGLRVPGTTDGDVDRAFDEGRLLRTHVMRPTWHFVEPGTIRWLLHLTAPRVHGMCTSQYRELEIDDRTRTRSQAVMARALRGGCTLTRPEIGAALERARISIDSRRLAYLLLAAELDAVICSGPRLGKQFTYALLDERVPLSGALGTEAALKELARRFFSTHGPATPRDFAWWGGLTVTTARAAIEMLGPTIESEKAGPLTYWVVPGAAPSRAARGDRAGHDAVYLLPVYDEYLVAYRDREAVPFDWPVRPRRGAVPAAYMNPLIIGGQVVGTWRRTLRPSAVVVEVITSRALTVTDRHALQRAADRYGAFVRKPVTMAE